MERRETFTLRRGSIRHEMISRLDHAGGPCLLRAGVERGGTATPDVGRGRRHARGACQRAAGDAPAAGWPLVFAFHGHGGDMTRASRSFPIHAVWPDAVVVYPAGPAHPGYAGRIAKGRWPGWQNMAGAQDNRDLKFLIRCSPVSARNFAIDDKRIYATGHSNGGLFTYLLWAERGDVFAAFAPSAALLARGSNAFQPKPVLHLGSPEDLLVKFASQERMIDYVRRLNGCGPRQAERWATPPIPRAKAPRSRRTCIRTATVTPRPRRNSLSSSSKRIRSRELWPFASGSLLQTLAFGLVALDQGGDLGVKSVLDGIKLADRLRELLLLQFVLNRQA